MAEETILVTGGAGFIGSNLVERLLSTRTARIRIFDNFSRRGVAYNLKWLSSLADNSRLEIVKGDVRDAEAVRRVTSDASEIYHLAAQVAVTTSVDDPVTDFDINAHGTFNVLEGARLAGRKPFVLFTSTNKVYGSLEAVPVIVNGTRYESQRADFLGVDESETARLPLALWLQQGSGRSICPRLCSHLRARFRCLSHELHRRSAPIR